MKRIHLTSCPTEKRRERRNGADDGALPPARSAVPLVPTNRPGKAVRSSEPYVLYSIFTSRKCL